METKRKMKMMNLANLMMNILAKLEHLQGMNMNWN